MDSVDCSGAYIGRLAPTPSGLKWFGIHWDDSISSTSQSSEFKLQNEENDSLNFDEKATKLQKIEKFIPYEQQYKNNEQYKNMWLGLFRKGFLYPSPQSRKDVERSISAPQEGDKEIIFPIEFRPEYVSDANYLPSSNSHFPDELRCLTEPTKVNWRFRMPDNKVISFTDERCGFQSFTCGTDFGDFIVWRSDGIPSYELAVVSDDASMKITEVVRGEDLLLSTARQLLLYEAIGVIPPKFFHCPLVRDKTGVRLAKRSPGETLRSLREQGFSPQQIVQEIFCQEAKDLLMSCPHFFNT